MKTKPKTVCGLLNNYKDNVFALACVTGKDNDLSECTNYIRSLLNTDEASEISQEDKDKCILTLRNSEKNKSLYYSTLTTWLLALKC